MVFVNCVIEENSPTQTSIDTCANVNCISPKHIGELGIAYIQSCTIFSQLRPSQD